MTRTKKKHDYDENMTQEDFEKRLNANWAKMENEDLSDADFLELAEDNKKIIEIYTEKL